jgi:hypothetical protein
MLALRNTTGTLEKLEFYNRNQNWQEQRKNDGSSEKLVNSAFELYDELKVLERKEAESLLTKDYGLTMRAKRSGFTIRNYGDLELLKENEIFWKKDLRSSQHKCRRMDAINCTVCHAEEKMENLMEFLYRRQQLHIQNPDQVHHCTYETVRMSKGCQLFNFSYNQRVEVLSSPGTFITATGAWFLCMDTGKMHWCNGKEQCTAVSIIKQDGVTLAYSCVISGYAKSPPTSSFNSWDGVRFFSVSRLDQIRNEMSSMEFTEIGGQEYDDGVDEGYDFEEFPEEDVENAVALDMGGQGDEMLDEGAIERKKGKDLTAENEDGSEKNKGESKETEVSKKKRKFSGLMDEVEEVEEEAGLEEETIPEQQQDDVDVIEDDGPQLALAVIPAPTAKRQRITDLMADKSKRDLENPLQNLKHEVATANCSIQELAFLLAQEKLAAEEELIESRKEVELQKNRQATRFSFGSGNRETRASVSKVQSSITVWKDKKRSREMTTTRKRTSRRVYTVLTREEKMTQFLARGTPEIANTMLRYLLAPETKNRIAQYRLKAAVEVANLSVAELNREVNVPFITQLGCWCEKISELVGGFLENETVALDFNRYSNVILSHWREASTSPLVTQVFNLHKKKKRKPLDFILHCIGVIYNMAEGGVTVRVKLTGSIPPVLLNSGERLRSVVLRGRLVREFPDESAALAGPILKPQFIQDLFQVYRDGYQFTDSSYNEAISTVKQCYETRHLAKQTEFYNIVEDWAREHERGQPVPPLESLYVNYCHALRPPHSAKTARDAGGDVFG